MMHNDDPDNDETDDPGVVGLDTTKPKPFGLKGMGEAKASGISTFVKFMEPKYYFYFQLFWSYPEMF